MTRRICGLLWLLFAAVTTFTFFSHPEKALAAENTEQQFLVERARITFLSFMADENMAWLRDNVKNARAIFILPEMLKGGFVIGGSGGRGVVLVRDEEKKDWSAPAFYTMGSVTLGIQIGGEISELILLVQSQKGLQSFYSSSFKVGGDASVAGGPVGVAGKVDLATDFLCFGRSKGAYAGVSLEGALITTRDEWNQAYYGQQVRPMDILMLRTVDNPGADGLRQALGEASR